MNLSELAKHLEISPTTVSRVLSGRAAQYRISARTVARVLDAAELHQVKPDLLGSSLRSGKLGMIGLVVPDITNPFFSGLARAIEREIRSSELTLQLCDSAEDEETERGLLAQMLGRRLDGVIVAPVTSNLEVMNALVREAPFPVVYVDRIQPGLEAPSVGIDNYRAGRLAASHLIESGRRGIACLRGDPASYIDQERYRGVQDTLAESRIPTRAEWVSGDGYSLDAACAGVRDILASEALPDAILTLSGQGILAVLQAATERGMRIPDQLSVLAFDDQPWSAFMNPSITTVEQPVEEMARRAVKLLLGEAPAVAPLLHARIRERDSVRWD